MEQNEIRIKSNKMRTEGAKKYLKQSNCRMSYCFISNSTLVNVYTTVQKNEEGGERDSKR